MTASQHSHVSLRRRVSQLLHRWHRRVGILISLFVVWMVISGWLLNHTAALDLARYPLRSDWLSRYYGLQVTPPETIALAGSHWLAVVADSVILDGKKIDVPLTSSLGLALDRTTLFAADKTLLVLLSVDGQLIDEIPAAMLPIPSIARLGTGCDGVVITDGEKVFATADAVTWRVCEDAVEWARSAPPSAAQSAVMTALVQPSISAERLLLDLHSGRFLGRWGPYFIDAVGFGLLLLALSGVWMFAHHRRRHPH